MGQFLQWNWKKIASRNNTSNYVETTMCTLNETLFVAEKSMLKLTFFQVGGKMANAERVTKESFTITFLIAEATEQFPVGVVEVTRGLFLQEKFRRVEKRKKEEEEKKKEESRIDSIRWGGTINV